MCIHPAPWYFVKKPKLRESTHLLAVLGQVQKSVSLDLSFAVHSKASLFLPPFQLGLVLGISSSSLSRIAVEVDDFVVDLTQTAAAWIAAS